MTALFLEEEREKPELLPCCDDPQEYLGFLRATSAYQGVVRERLTRAQGQFQEMPGGVRLGNPPEYNEVAQVFEEREGFKKLFWDFYESVLHLKYNQERYSFSFRKAFEKYKLAVSESLGAVRNGRDEDTIREKDRLRSVAHNDAAEMLVDNGVVSTEFLARIIIRAFLVDVGCDYISSARLADRLRILRELPDRSALLRFLMSEPSTGGDIPFFSTEQARTLQEEFLRAHPNQALIYVEGKRFLRLPPDFLTNCLPPQGDQENTLVPK